LRSPDSSNSNRPVPAVDVKEQRTETSQLWYPSRDFIHILPMANNFGTDRPLQLQRAPPRHPPLDLYMHLYSPGSSGYGGQSKRQEHVRSRCRPSLTASLALLTDPSTSFFGVFWKFARIGERLSPYVSLCCFVMAVWNPIQQINRYQAHGRQVVTFLG
jgi:hypothetical protein